MNLETLAGFRGEAWARRILRRKFPEGCAPAAHPWPGKIKEARRMAKTFGRPGLVAALAAIIQKRASAAWSLPAKC
jgi:hypothetical protein